MLMAVAGGGKNTDFSYLGQFGGKSLFHLKYPPTLTTMSDHQSICPQSSPGHQHPKTCLALCKFYFNYQEMGNIIHCLPQVSGSETYIEVDTPDLFPEECLIHEDCPQDSFCSPQPDNTYVTLVFIYILYFLLVFASCLTLTRSGQISDTTSSGDSLIPQTHT